MYPNTQNLVDAGIQFINTLQFLCKHKGRARTRERSPRHIKHMHNMYVLQYRRVCVCVHFTACSLFPWRKRARAHLISIPHTVVRSHRAPASPKLIASVSLARMCVCVWAPLSMICPPRAPAIIVSTSTYLPPPASLARPTSTRHLRRHTPKPTDYKLCCRAKWVYGMVRGVSAPRSVNAM